MIFWANVQSVSDSSNNVLYIFGIGPVSRFKTAAGALKEEKPYLYQEIDGKKVAGTVLLPRPNMQRLS